MAANRVGKTVAGAYELSVHTTGNYPPWWTGRRYDGPVDVWAAGKKLLTVRDIIQLELFGPIEDIGTGLIPGDNIVSYTKRQGVPDAIESARVKHMSGGFSKIGLKSYDQGWESFQGTAKHMIWLDEESDEKIYAECLLRTMTCDGIIVLTFTPLLGISAVVKMFLEDGKIPNEEACQQ